MKKLLSLIFVAIMVFATFSAAIPVGAAGDINGDETINMRDVLTLRRLLGGVDVYGYDLSECNICQDGVISMRDLLGLRCFISGISDIPCDPPSGATAQNGQKLSVSGASVMYGDDSGTSFSVSVSRNPGIWSAQIMFIYDSDASFRSFEIGSVFGRESFQLKPDSNNLYDLEIYEWFDKFDGLASALDSAGISPDGKKMVAVTIENSDLSNNTGNGTLFNVTLDTSMLPAGLYDIDVVYIAKNTIGEDYRLVPFDIEQGKLEIAEADHDWALSLSVQPTCTHPGYNEYVCRNCGVTYREETPPTGIHSWDAGVVTTQPTYKTEGVRTYTCTVCGTTYTEPVPVLPPKPGDVDGSGVLNVKDITLLKQYLSSSMSIDDIVDVNSDVDGDDTLGVKDLKALKLLLAGN